MIEHAPFILQVISAIIAPILTAAIAWITNSLRKTNQRIDALEKSFHDNRFDDQEKLADLAKSISAMNATNEAFIREMTGMRQQLNRVETYLHKHER